MSASIIQMPRFHSDPNEIRLKKSSQDIAVLRDLIDNNHESKHPMSQFDIMKCSQYIEDLIRENQSLSEDLNACTQAKLKQHDQNIHQKSKLVHKLKTENHLSYILDEITTTERDFLFKMRSMESELLNPVFHNDEARLKVYFPEWERLITTHQQFYNRINEGHQNKSRLLDAILDAFEKSVPSFQTVYAVYLKAYRPSQLKLNEATVNNKSWFSSNHKNKNKNQLTLDERKKIDAFRIIPIQRFLKYPLLIQSIKQTILNDHYHENENKPLMLRIDHVEISMKRIASQLNTLYTV